MTSVELYGMKPTLTIVKTYNIGNPVAADVTATLYSDGLLEFDGTGDIEKYYFNHTGDYKYTPWMDDKDNIKSISFKQGNTIQPTSTSYLFGSLSEITFIDISNLDSSNITDIARMFNGCESLTKIKGIENFNTSKASSMYYMFGDCKSLTLLDISNFNTSNVTNMSYMFTECNSLVSLDLSKWDTSKVTDMSMMFDGCQNLIEIKGIENFNTSKIDSISNMFSGCNSLVSLDLTKWDTSNFEYMDRTFYFCEKLNAEITIIHELLYYNNIFYNAATEPGCQIIVNYNDATKDYIDTYIATNSENSTVIKGITIDETIA